VADSFQQRISLEGAEDIIKNLQAIGSEATKAIGQLKTAVTSANPALAALSTTSLAAQNAMKGFSAAISQATTVVAPFSASLGGLLSVFGAFAGPAGVLAAVGGLGVFLKHTADSVVEMDRQARALGLSIEQFKALSRVAKEAGVSQEQVARSLQQVATQVAAQARQQLG
jgi:ABC-type transporter Mla subunit MlaD